jgi:hypothetical protein
MSKTVSARISIDLHDELRDRCNQLGCTINEFVAESIKFAMYGYAEFAFDPEEEDEENEPTCEKISQNPLSASDKPVPAYKIRIVE